jgi:hypothetical protein
LPPLLLLLLLLSQLLLLLLGLSPAVLGPCVFVCVSLGAIEGALSLD